MDRLTKDKRSWNMSRIPSKNTIPEKVVRSALFHHGLRFRINKKDLPGKPDIVLAKHKTVIFVNGCFWHGHQNCKKANYPKSNTDFWIKKIENNIKRDEKVAIELRNLGWKVYIVWECQTEDKDILNRIIYAIFSLDCERK